MINKRKLDEMVNEATYEPVKLCARPFEEYCVTPFYQEHVCGFVSKFWMPGLLAEYLYEDCYYEDIETLKANLDYINSVMAQKQFYETWADITVKNLLENIERQKERAAKSEEIPTEDSYNDDLGELIDAIIEK